MIRSLLRVRVNAWVLAGLSVHTASTSNSTQPVTLNRPNTIVHNSRACLPSQALDAQVENGIITPAQRDAALASYGTGDPAADAATLRGWCRAFLDGVGTGKDPVKPR
jgi:hypothetical protein